MTGRVAEEWRPIGGYEGIYSVSNLGRVRSEERVVPWGSGRRRVPERILSPVLRGYGAGYVRLSRRGDWEQISVPKLVARAFLGKPPPGHRLRPKDGNWSNAAAGNLLYAPTRKTEGAARKAARREGGRPGPSPKRRAKAGQRKRSLSFRLSEETQEQIVAIAAHLGTPSRTEAVETAVRGCYRRLRSGQAGRRSREGEG